MSTKYDRISFPDSVKFASHSDNEFEPEMDAFSTGVYHDHTIYPRRRDRTVFKLACLRIRNRQTLFFLIAGFVVALLTLVIIIGITAMHTDSTKNKTSDRTTNNKDYGLFFYPEVDGSSVIKFDPTSLNSYKPYVDNLDYHMHVYSPVPQMHDANRYVVCTENTTQPLPEGKVCRFTAEDLGEECNHINMYGYKEGRPCVLLVLKLPDNMTPEPFDVNNSFVHKILNDRLSPYHVGISCAGETDKDQENIGTQQTVGPPMKYMPNKGFMTSFFPTQLNNSLYILPAVSVQFNTVANKHAVAVKCVAWAENFNNGEPQNSELYIARFVINIG
ncbi:hypothetical protein CHS0354_033724 [Potamilus streckersoni]|uniref:Uncharacterized protein n=1 Tax=Potamilus streckersoni TaxID=2493646 RepID=A0AAE0S2I7_9BIVA|nr:hypothetical protein CHS0354_033724 [Potamilus streckersoni]